MTENYQVLTDLSDRSSRSILANKTTFGSKFASGARAFWASRQMRVIKVFLDVFARESIDFKKIC